MSRAIPAQHDASTRARRNYFRDNQRYQLVGCIARGIGMQVYKARDRRQEWQIVAIKRLESSHTSLERFFRELGMMRLLSQHYPQLPITHVLDWFCGERAWYLVMPYVDGHSLETVLQERGGPLPVEEAIAIGLNLCAILKVLHAHARPVIHRDIKPANILRDRGRRIILADFGTACFADSPVEALSRGSLAYAAPEQRGGEPVTPAADVYGLGATLYELLTGQVPLGSMPLLAHTGAIPAEVRQLLQRMVQQDVRQRIGSVQAVEQALLELAHWHMERQTLASTLPEHLRVLKNVAGRQLEGLLEQVTSSPRFTIPIRAGEEVSPLCLTRPNVRYWPSVHHAHLRRK